MSSAQIAALVTAEQKTGLGYAEAVAKVSRETGIKGGEVMRAVIFERDKT